MDPHELKNYWFGQALYRAGINPTAGTSSRLTPCRAISSSSAMTSAGLRRKCKSQSASGWPATGCAGAGPSS